MLDIQDVTDVHWVNDAKTRVSAFVTYNNGTSELLSISVSDTSEFWQHISNTIPLETIDANTEDVLRGNRERRKVDEYRQQEREVQKKHNALFNSKLEAFDMIEVANASSARKSKIRKAKSLTEVYSHVAIAIQEYEQSQNG